MWGGYYFDNPDAVFDQIAGPRVRSELRLYDLAVLGDGSRLTLEGLIQHDQLRDTQAEGGVYIRIPFGSGPRRRMDRLQRRMADRIVRDVDVVAQRQVTDEAALFADSEFTVSSAHVVDAGDDLSDAVAAAGANSLVVLDGSAGIISESDTTILSTGQVVLGGSGTLAVVGADTGAQVTFSAPGTRPQVTGTDTANDVFQIADDTVLAGLDIVGGNNGVYGDGVTGFTIRDLDVSGANSDGVDLVGTNSGNVSDSTFQDNNRYGFRVATLSGGTISGNTASGNTSDGFKIGSEQQWDLTDDFSKTDNPTGVWSYGTALSGTFTLYDRTRIDRGTDTIWQYATLISNAPHLWKNESGATVTGNPNGSVSLHPGPDVEAQPSIARWTAPVGGAATLTGSFGAGDGGVADARIKYNEATISESLDFTTDQPFSITQTVSAGDTFDWVVSGVFGGGNTPLTTTVTLDSGGFSASNTASFSSNASTDNNSQGYNIRGAPALGSNSNTGSGNDSNDSF